MNDYQEYRSYGSYLSRVFAIIIAFLLLVLAIWFVVRLANDDDSETIGDSSTAEVDRSGNESDLFIVNETEEPSEEGPSVVIIEDDEATADEAEEEGQILATNTDEDDNSVAQASGIVAGAATDDNLPNTGASPALILLVPAVVFLASKYTIASQE